MNFYWSIVFCFFLHLFAFVGFAEESLPVFTARGIAVDGRLDEAAWRAAPCGSDFVLLKAQGGGASSVRTEFRMLSDGESLYFGVTCFEPARSELRADLRGPDANPWRNDLVELFLAPTGVGDEYYQFALSAGGASWQQFFGEHGNIRPDPYFPEYSFATQIFDDRWELEARLPFAAFYLTSADRWSGVWLANVTRHRCAGTPEDSTWSPLSSSFHESDDFRHLAGVPSKPDRYDLLLKSAEFRQTGSSPEGYRGDVLVEIHANDVPPGDYRIRCGEREVLFKLQAGRNVVTLPRMTLPEGGRNLLRLEVTDAAGRTVAARQYPVLVEPASVRLHFTRPQYGGNFYPGEDSSRLEGRVEVFSEASEVTLEVGGVRQVLQVHDRQAFFSIDVAELPEPLAVRVDGEQRCTVRRLPTARAWVRDGRLVVDGKSFFLLGWYGASGWKCSRAQRERYSTSAAKHPFNDREWINLEPSRLCDWDVEGEEMVLDRPPSERVLEAFRRAVAAAQDADGFLYYLCDEPECRGLSPIYLKHLYRFVKELDPTRVVMIITREPLKYLECADILNPHPYLSPTVDEKGARHYHQTLAAAGDLYAAVEELQRPDKVLMATPQAFSYNFNNRNADFPTFDEFNASVWAAVCHGARGITPFIFYDHLSRPCTDVAADYVFTSLDRLAPVLAEAETLPLDCRSDGPVAARLCENGADRLLVACNLQNAPTTVSCAAEALRETPRWHRFREAGEVAAQDDEIKLELAPYQVVVLTSRKLDEGLPTLTAVRQELARREAERSSRGNLLFGRGREVAVAFPPSRPYELCNAMEQQDKLFDGVLDAGAWLPMNVEGELWYELTLPSETKPFRRLRVWGADLAGLAVKFRSDVAEPWRDAPAPAATSQGRYCVEVECPEPQRVRRIRLEFRTGSKPELYEFELLEQ